MADYGTAVQEVHFKPDGDLSVAISRIVAATKAIDALLPAGTQPPIFVHGASALAVLQIALRSNTLKEHPLYNYRTYWLGNAGADPWCHSVDRGRRELSPVDIGPVKSSGTCIISHAMRYSRMVIKSLFSTSRGSSRVG
jgi:hypothetical protein